MSTDADPIITRRELLSVPLVLITLVAAAGVLGAPVSTVSDQSLGDTLTRLWQAALLLGSATALVVPRLTVRRIDMALVAEAGGCVLVAIGAAVYVYSLLHASGVSGATAAAFVTGAAWPFAWQAGAIYLRVGSALIASSRSPR